MDLVASVVSLIVVVLSIVLASMVFYFVGIEEINNIPNLNNGVKVTLTIFYPVIIIAIGRTLLYITVESIKDIYNQIDK